MMWLLAKTRLGGPRFEKTSIVIKVPFSQQLHFLIFCTLSDFSGKKTFIFDCTILSFVRFQRGSLPNVLKKKTTKYLYQLMVETSRGITWMKASLPEGIEFAHRTGISDKNEANLRGAMNEIGIFKLPNGKHIILSIYLKNITEEREDTEKIIADLTKATWKYFTQKTPEIEN